MKKHLNIMVVDDEPGVLQLLKRILEPEGYGLTIADNGTSALAQFEECMPDLVILDIVMPGLNGFQVLDFIRQRSRVPVVILTGRGGVTTACDTLNLGADDYVKKPFHTRELLARIRAKLRRARPEVTIPVK